MIILFKIEGRKTTVQINGHDLEFKTAFLYRLNFKDLINWVVSESKKVKSKS